jgi:uncharacterized protein YndB with AHSA1/START domain
MTGPAGEISRGYWVFERVDAPTTIEVQDGFADADGRPNDDLPRMRMTFERTDRGSRFVSVTRFPSVDAMEKVVAMGMIEGLRAALGQMDDVLADLRGSFAKTELEVVDDTHVRITREVRGSLAQVWRAHHEPALLKRWMLGPDGWTMPVCEPAVKVGDTYRWEWEREGGGQRFGFTGELLEAESPRRSVMTERMIGTDGPSTVNELTLEPRPGERTRISILVTYPSKEVRDAIIGTGMVDGMEASYARLEQVAA